MALETIVHFQSGKGSLFEQILAQGETVYGKLGSCGGRGACGKCRVRFLTAPPMPSFADRRFLTPSQLRDGYRLACTAKPYTDCDVELCFVEAARTEILTVSGAMLKNSEQERGVSSKGKKTDKEIDIISEDGDRFCAVDLGTTTVVMQLIDKKTGGILLTHAFQNPQRAYGIDVLARICAAENGMAEQMRTAVLTELDNGIRKMERLGQIQEIIISGNTTMGHLLLGYPVEGLGKAPFTPYHIETSYFDLSGHPAVFLPGISAFVGADITAGIYACGMAEREEPSLFIDLGTNGEMAVGNKEHILCTAAAAGSAFEGSVSAQIIGTDMTALACDMLETGIIDSTGLMEEPWFTEGYRVGDFCVSQQDIRGLQMAKAAICAGASILLDRADAWKGLAHVYLAGGFGYYLDVDKAAAIGLIPKALWEKCTAVGNTSLAGAIRYGRSDQAVREKELEQIVRVSHSINLAQQPEFETRYIKAMAFEEMG